MWPEVIILPCCIALHVPRIGSTKLKEQDFHFCAQERAVHLWNETKEENSTAVSTCWIKSIQRRVLKGFVSLIVSNFCTTSQKPSIGRFPTVWCRFNCPPWFTQVALISFDCTNFSFKLLWAGDGGDGWCWEVRSMLKWKYPMGTCDYDLICCVQPYASSVVRSSLVKLVNVVQWILQPIPKFRDSCSEKEIDSSGGPKGVPVWFADIWKNGFWCYTASATCLQLYALCLPYLLSWMVWIQAASAITTGSMTSPKGDLCGRKRFESDWRRACFADLCVISLINCRRNHSREWVSHLSS